LHIHAIKSRVGKLKTSVGKLKNFFGASRRIFSKNLCPPWPETMPAPLAMVTPLCPLCRGVLQMNSLITQALYQNQTLHGLHEVMAIF